MTVLADTIWTYGPGIPRYLGLWVVLLPVLVAGLWWFGARRGALVAIALSTLTSLGRNPPTWLGLPLRSWVFAGALTYVALWLVARVRAGGGDEALAPQRVRWPVVLGLVGLALVLRVPLAWWDPGISQIGTSTERAANVLLDGDNPYAVPNPDADYGYYQYPAGTLLLHTPLVALVPDEVFGEEHLGIRMTLWLTDVLAVVFLAWAGARLGHAWGGLAAAFAYAVHPTLIRESGMSVSNDVLLALCVAAVAVMLALRRDRPAALLAGLAIAIKPSAALVLPVLWLASGWLTVAWAVAVPVVLQLPFLVFGSPGFSEIRGILEPAARSEQLPVLRADSFWWPFYAHAGGGRGALRFAAYVGLVVSIAVGVWAGRELRRRGRAPVRCAAALALPLLVSYGLASVQRTNYQDWYLTALVLAVGLSVRVRAREPVPA